MRALEQSTLFALMITSGCIKNYDWGWVSDMIDKGSASNTLNEPQQLLIYEHSYLEMNGVRQKLHILIKWRRQWAAAD